MTPWEMLKFDPCIKVLPNEVAHSDKSSILDLWEVYPNWREHGIAAH
jgi:hypothetical protein